MPDTAFILFFAVIVVAAGSLFYNRMSGERLLRDGLYRIQLQGLSLSFLDEKWVHDQERTDVVICLTTIPSRIESLQPTLKSLLNQTRSPARIRIHVPHFSIREKCRYVIPDWMNGLQSVVIVHCDDYGPATKLLPALRDFEENQPLLVVDDDRIYRRNLVETTVRLANSNPEVAFGFTGWNVPPDFVDRPTTLINELLERAPVPLRCNRQKQPRRIDILQGLSGYLVRPKFFDYDEISDYSQAPAAAFFVDDVWISGHCNVPRYVFPAPSSNFPLRSDRAAGSSTRLGLINRGGGIPEQRNNSILLKYLRDRWN